MNITLGNEFEKRIASKVESGLYTSASEVIRDGLRLLFEKDASREQKERILKEEVSRGFLQLEAGKTSSNSIADIFQEVQAMHGEENQ